MMAGGRFMRNNEDSTTALVATSRVERTANSHYQSRSWSHHATRNFNVLLY